MNKSLVLSAGFFLGLILGCGGGDGGGSATASNTSSTPTDDIARVEGTWTGELVSSNFDCNLNLEEDPMLTASMWIVQDGSQVTTMYGDPCDGPEVQSGLATSDGMASSGQAPTRCPSGQDAAIVHSFELHGVEGNTAQRMVFKLEFGCPDESLFCFQEWTGVGNRVSSFPQTCSTTSGTPTSSANVQNNSANNPSSTSTAPPPPPAPCGSCNLQGCCSNHGGVASCSGNGQRVTCADGTLSVTCRC